MLIAWGSFGIVIYVAAYRFNEKCALNSLVTLPSG